MRPKIGAHVSAAGGVERAIERAKELGAECFQFFSRSPQGGAAPKISDEQARAFRERCEAEEMTSYIHAPYYINFASKQKRLAAAAPRIIREELERASRLGVKYVITHLGSEFEWEGDDVHTAVIRQVVEGLRSIYEGQPEFSAQLLLELSAGSGAVIGDTFEELAEILAGLGRDDVHVCLDTCHMLASGYDVRTPEAVAETMAAFDRTVGLSQLKLMHANDSKTGLGSHKDRHEHIGQGEIGEAGFKALLAHPDLQKVNFVAETPHDERLVEDVRLLKVWRK